MHNECMARSEWGSLERRGLSWDVRWRDPVTKKPRRKRVGSVADIGQNPGHAERVRILKDFKARHVGDAGQTFEEFLDSYEHLYRLRVRPLTFASTYPQMRRVAALLPCPMQAVDAAAAERVVAAMGLCARSTAVLIIRLGHFWKAAKRHGVACDNPWRSVPRPSVQKRVPVVMTVGGLDAYVAAAPDDLKVLVRVLGECGLRIGEARGLTWEDVADGSLLVRHSKSEPRRVTLTPDAKKAIDSLPVPARKTNALFPSIRNDSRRSWAHERFKKACRDAGLKPIRFHDLRHSTGYRMARSGASAKQIGHALGITEQTAQLYSNHRPGELGNRAFELMLSHEASERAAAKKAT